MMIGFSQRIQTVSEGLVPGVDLFQHQIDVSAIRISEREHPMMFRLLESSSNATVEPFTTQATNFFDALFGRRLQPGDPLEDHYDFLPGMNMLRLLLYIRNDLVLEGDECFTIRLFPVDVAGHHELFSCDEDDVRADNYFCEHTICIEDDDGRCYNFERKFITAHSVVNLL